MLERGVKMAEKMNKQILKADLIRKYEVEKNENKN